MMITDIKDWNDLPDNFTGVIRYWTGSKYWFQSGSLHREDGPAIEYSAGYAEYYLNGEKTYQAEIVT
jgi:hypothetical protein